jgi:hypothetical protein
MEIFLLITGYATGLGFSYSYFKSKNTYLSIGYLQTVHFKVLDITFPDSHLGHTILEMATGGG